MPFDAPPTGDDSPPSARGCPEQWRVIATVAGQSLRSVRLSLPDAARMAALTGGEIRPAHLKAMAKADHRRNRALAKAGVLPRTVWWRR